MATLPTILSSQVSLPSSVEGQVPQLPKLSLSMSSIASSLPKGPDLPLSAMAPPSISVPSLPSGVTAPSSVLSRINLPTSTVTGPGGVISTPPNVIPPAPTGALTSATNFASGILQSASQQLGRGSLG